MVLGEGAGVVILEELSSAQKRGAKILGEVIGYGSSSVASRQGVGDYKTAFSNVLQSALETSGLKPADVGHVHAHGLSSPKCDRQEAEAIQSIMGQTPVTAAKSYMGNLGGGSGMIEMTSSMLAIQKDSLFPILNCDSRSDDCPITAVREKGTSPGDSFISTSITPQGQASSIAIRAFTG